MKCNQPRPSFELRPPSSFSTTITITPRTLPYPNSQGIIAYLTSVIGFFRIFHEYIFAFYYTVHHHHHHHPSSSSSSSSSSSYYYYYYYYYYYFQLFFQFLTIHHLVSSKTSSEGKLWVYAFFVSFIIYGVNFLITLIGLTKRGQQLF